MCVCVRAYERIYNDWTTVIQLTRRIQLYHNNIDGDYFTLFVIEVRK